MTTLGNDNSEAKRTDCFLCDPCNTLLINRAGSGQTLAGLGPIVDGYCVISSIAHGGLSSLSRSDRIEYYDYVDWIRAKLIKHYGNCLLTEHGKLPVCFTDQSPGQHCFHPHFLAFPGAPNILPEARKFFTKSREFSNLDEAVEFGILKPHYFLVSPSPTNFEVFYSPTTLPRQLARALVANALHVPVLSDWRSRPNIGAAEKIAEHLQQLIEQSTDSCKAKSE